MASPLEITIDARELEAVARAWSAAPAMVIEELGRGALEASLFLEREVKEITPVGVHGEGGGLKGSIGAREPEVLSDQVIGRVGTSIAYAEPVELGTRPHFPPVRPLVDWARVKLGLGPEEAERAGMAIARKIAARGTKGQFMFTRALEAGRGQVERIYQAAARRIVDRLARGAD